MRLFRPLIAGANLRERLIACAGAGLAIALTTLLCRLITPSPGVPLLIAAIGGSAALIFAVPSSPLAQPWPCIGGNTLSALVGVAAYHAVPEPTLAAAVAVAGSMIVMSLFRCLHPPGGAAALAVVIGTPAVHAAGLRFAFVPVAINSLAMVACAIAFHRATGHNYPHRVTPPVPTPAGLERSDVDAALAEMHESFDIAPEDLDALLVRAEAHALARRRG
jgi:CBS domain-containing membrane protein